MFSICSSSSTTASVSSAYFAAGFAATARSHSGELAWAAGTAIAINSSATAPAIHCDRLVRCTARSFQNDLLLVSCPDDFKKAAQRRVRFWRKIEPSQTHVPLALQACVLFFAAHFIHQN